STVVVETGQPEYSADDLSVDEDNVVIVSRDGWVKRQKEVKDLSTTRLREGDGVLAAFAGSTRATCVFFSNFGVAYTCRIADVPASTGYGEPIQRLFKLKDGERIVAAVTGKETLIAATAAARALLCSVEEVNYLSGPGRGVILIKLAAADDRVLGFIASKGDRDLMTVETTRGGEQTISTAKYEVTGRGGKGRELLQRGQFTKVVTPPPDVPPPLPE